MTENEYPSTPRLSPDAKFWICDQCHQEWMPGTAPNCEPCAAAWRAIERAQTIDRARESAETARNRAADALVADSARQAGERAMTDAMSLDEIEALLAKATPGPVYVTADRDNADDLPDHWDIWTLSHEPDLTGWETDSGCPGYGLTKPEADLYATLRNNAAALVAAARKNERLREALRKIAHEHLQFAAYYEDRDHAAQLEARAALASKEPT